MNDELASYFYFVDKGVLVTASYYPSTNNHIFFSELCCLVNFFSDNILLVMRLPAFIFSILTCLVLYITIKRFFSFRVALLTVVSFSFAYHIFYYAIHGRGYSILMFFIVLSLYAILKLLLSKEHSRFYAAVYICSSILGFYTMPLFLYPFLSFTVFSFWFLMMNRKGGYIKFIIINLFIAGGICILYAPVILMSGISTITSNPWMTPLSWSVFWNTLLNYLSELSAYLLNIDQYGGVCLAIVLICGIALLAKKQKEFAWLSLFFFVIPLLMIIIQRLHYFVRIWDYLWIIIALLVGVIISFVISLFNNERLRTWIYSIVVVLIIFNGYRQIDHVVNKKGFGYYVQLDSFIGKVFESNFSSAYISEDTYYLFISYNSEHRKMPIQLFYTAAAKDPELIVQAKSEKFPVWLNQGNYELFIQNSFVNSYRKIALK
ncbi:MAG: glycosyltransferase family 39 protein [Cytophagaceae bacterium]|nr:glycosyltransferase family 39 protein [Cytophagaceae bacterium]